MKCFLWSLPFEVVAVHVVAEVGLPVSCVAREEASREDLRVCDGLGVHESWKEAAWGRFGGIGISAYCQHGKVSDNGADYCLLLCVYTQCPG